MASQAEIYAAAKPLPGQLGCDAGDKHYPRMFALWWLVVTELAYRGRPPMRHRIWTVLLGDVKLVVDWKDRPTSEDCAIFRDAWDACREDGRCVQHMFKGEEV